MPVNYGAIPAEMREFKQWCLWKYVDVGEGKKQTKVPYTVRNTKASVTNHYDWSDFATVIAVLEFGGYDGIGFVFTKNDPYAFIDLDDTTDEVDIERQVKVFNEFDSYSERSPSGNGLHVIVKGSIPQGRRRSSIEIYSTERYATMTGDVQSDKPIADCNELLNVLFNQMGGTPSVVNNTPNKAEVQSDEGILELAHKHNSETFASLSLGQWQGKYPSQSEADLAYMNIIAYYTDNREQVKRIYSKSELAKTDAKRKTPYYLNKTVNLAFDQKLPSIDITGFKNALEKKLEQQQQQSSAEWAADANVSNLNGHSTVNSGPELSVATTNIPLSSIQPPPGLVGEIARFIYDAAPRPVPEIAIAGAMGLMAGICGRAYNISGTGLNQYILCLAMTGAGKEAMASGIDKIVNEVQKQVPVANEFIGPAEIQSGQALVKYLSTQSSCFVSILGEFGLRLKSMSSERANSAEIGLRRMLLDFYNKSGHGQVSRPTIYADQSKNINFLMSPAFSILGESTPERFYDILNEEMISEGLLPRFMLIEYNGPRPQNNANAVNVYPPDWLVNKIAQLMANVKTIMANRNVINVQSSDDAHKMFVDFDKLADSKINSTDKEIIRQLWNRAHIKVMKIAALIAVGINYSNPVIEAEHVVWAKNIVEHDIKSLSDKFISGIIGKSSEEIKQINDMKKMIKFFVSQPFDKVKSNCKDQRLHSEKVVPVSFLSARLYSMASFRNDKVGQGMALKRTIQNLIDSDYIREISKKDMIDKFGSTARCFVVSNYSELSDD